MKVRNRQGFSVVEVMVVLGIMSVIAYYGMTPLLSFMKTQKTVDVKLTLSQIRENIRSTILNGKAWQKTIAVNSQMSCISTGTTCSAFTTGTYFLNLRDGNDTLLINSSTPTAGFTDAGSPCNAWSASGNPACPIRIRLRWTAVCMNTSCIHPQVLISGRFEYSPGDQQKRTPIYLDIYDISIYKTSGSIFEPIIIQYVESDSTGEGPCDKTNWRTRKLNRVFVDSGANATLNPLTNRFTLKAGSYTCDIAAPSFKIQGTSLRLVTTSPSASIVSYGTGAIAGPTITYSNLHTVFTLGVDSTFEVQQTCAATGTDYTNAFYTGNSNLDFGVPLSIPSLGYAYDIIYTTVSCARIN